MAPVPPPPPPPPNLRRHHTMDEDVYAPSMHAGIPPPADWFAPPPPAPPPPVLGFHGGMHHDVDTTIGAGSPRAPSVKRRPPQAHREHSKYDLRDPKPSVLAGLAGTGRGMHRVSEWINYVEPGLPEVDQPPLVL